MSCSKAKGALRECASVLAEIEWVLGPNGWECPWCKASVAAYLTMRPSHKSYCRRQAALRTARDILGC